MKIKVSGKGNAKLNPEAVGRIKIALEHGYSRRSIGQHFGVGTETISRIARGDSWSRVVFVPDMGEDALEGALERLQEVAKETPKGGGGREATEIEQMCFEKFGQPLPKGVRGRGKV